MVYGLVYDSEGDEWYGGYGRTVYEPDLRLRYANCKLDGFDFARGRTSWCICEEVVLLILPLSRKRRKQCRECRECSPIGKVPAEFSVESFQKGLHSLHCLHQ